MGRLTDQNTKLTLNFEEHAGYFTTLEDFKITWQTIYDAFALALEASNIDISVLGDPTYNQLQDWLNIIQSAGRIEGGEFTSHTDAVTGVTTGGAGSGEFKVAGDQTTFFSAALVFSITGSTGNDGDYTVKAGGSTYTGDTTTIPVDEAVSDATVDGDTFNGRLDIAAGKGFIKIEESHAASTKSFEWTAQENLKLTGDSTNYIYVDYNSGSPIIKATTDRSSISLHTAFKLGITYKGNGTTYPFESGCNINDLVAHLHEMLVETNKFRRTSGGNISAYATSGIQSEEGVFYRGLNKVPTEAKNSTTHKFTSVYYNGSNWIWTANQTAIDLAYYNNIASGLVELQNSQSYGVHWICIDFKGNMFAVYGQGDYTLTEARLVNAPTTLPVVAGDFGVIAAKIIFKKDIAVFEEIIPQYVVTVTSPQPPIHNETTSKQGGTTNEYYHLTSDQHSNLDKVEIIAACSDETTDLETGTGKLTFRMPYAMTVTKVYADVNTAPVGSTIIIDINESGSSILSTKLTIDVGEKDSEDAAIPAVISDSSLAKRAEITFDIDQIGSSTPGKGLKVTLEGKRA